MCAKRSVARWFALPLPAEPYVSVPGFAFASAMSCLIERAGTEGWTVATSVTIIAVACYILYHMLQDLDVDDVMEAMRGTDLRTILLAGLCVAAGYFTLTFYDLFALRAIGRSEVPYRIAAFSGFTSYSIGHNVGASVFTGGAVRYRVYSAWGLSGIDVVAVSPPSEWLAVGSPSGLYLFPPRRGPGALVRPGDIAAAAGGPTHVYIAVGNRIEIAPLSTDTARAWPGVDAGSAVYALAFDTTRALLWAATGRGLVSFRATGDSLEELGAAPLAGAGLRIALSGDTLAVALGERKLLADAVRFACSAAAQSVTKRGAQPSAPTRRAIERQLRGETA